MIAIIDTTVRSVTLDSEVIGSVLVDVLDFLFPNEEWKKYTIKIDTNMKHSIHENEILSKLPKVQINRFKAKDIHPWNEGYQFIKASSGSVSTRTPTAKSKVSTNVLANARPISRLVYSSYVVELIDG